MDVRDARLIQVIHGGTSNWLLRLLAHGRFVTWEGFRTRADVNMSFYKRNSQLPIGLLHHPHRLRRRQTRRSSLRRPLLIRTRSSSVAALDGCSFDVKAKTSPIIESLHGVSPRPNKVLTSVTQSSPSCFRDPYSPHYSPQHAGG